jgi:2,4-diketo-3-deoxy-L-fuconate hydrolase
VKICRFAPDRLGLVIDQEVYDISALRDGLLAKPAGGPDWSDPVIRRLPDLMAKIPDALPGCKRRPLAEVKLLSPVKAPSKLVAAPTNYRAHIAEMSADRTIKHAAHSQDIGEAGMFLKATSAMVGPSEGVALRFLDRRNDHEVELAIVIGKTANQVAKETALDYVAGYCIGLDITLRGPEDRSFRKSIDTYAALGPWMVTRDEIADPDNLDISLAVNGAPRQKANTRDMVYSVARLIEFSSSFYTLHPGDVIYTGTPHGVGPIRPGDLLTAECEKIGRMNVKVRAAE